MGAWSGVRSLRAVTVTGLVAVGTIAAGVGHASAAQCASWGGLPPNVGSGGNELEGVAATSVGSYFNGSNSQNLILHCC